MKTAAIISYSSYHNAFIGKCIEEAKKVADDVIVVSHDHFYHGEYDNELLTDLGKKHHITQYVYEWFPGFPSRYYHNDLRHLGYKSLKGDYDSVFFIDSDEILEGDRVKEWLDNQAQKNCDYKLSHFWYYRDTCYRANTPEEGAVLVSAKTLKNTNWFGGREREDYSNKWCRMESYMGRVLGHHYSWAGTKEMLLTKVRSWGHNADNVDWQGMVEQEFTHEFNGSCPFKPYTFTKIEPYINFTFNE